MKLKSQNKESLKPSDKKKKSVSTAKSKKTLKSAKEPQTMDELLSMSSKIKFSVTKGETVDGVVVSVSPKEILIDIGKKSYGIVAEWELDQVKEYAATLKPGDKITAQVINPENDLGFVVLSLRRANIERRWTFLKEAKEQGRDIEVSAMETTRGGLLIDWQGLRGFIPSTQLEREYVSSPIRLIGKKIRVKVLEVDRSLNRLVVSQKAAALGVTPTVQKEKLDKIHPEDVFKGVVSGIAPFGIFVDVEGLEGLVHISEIAWEKVENPADLFKVEDEVDVMVLNVNKEEGKLNLSIKRLTPDPWKNILDRYPLESTVSGKVIRRAPYGVFVQLEPGIEGLLHISKITPGEEPKVGQKIDCMIESIDPIRRKISLTVILKEKPVGYR